MRRHLSICRTAASFQCWCFFEEQAVEVATIGHDSVFGAGAALDSRISSTSAVVVLPGTASVLDAADFQAATRRSVTFRVMVARYEQALLATPQQSAACNASRSVEPRLARWLLRARSMRRRNVVDASGYSGTADRLTTQRDFDCRPCVAASEDGADAGKRTCVPFYLANDACKAHPPSRLPRMA